MTRGIIFITEATYAQTLIKNAIAPPPENSHIFPLTRKTPATGEKPN